MNRFEEAFLRLDQSLRERMQVYHTPAMSLALTDRNKLIHGAVYGYANLAAQIVLQPEHLIAIGSIGKVFTGIAVLLASEKGMLDLRSPVSIYLPWFQVQSKYSSITIHHLLTHSSGLPLGTDFSPDPRAEIYALRDIEVGFAPGSHFYYSDAGYKVLGLVLEAVTGRSYASIIKEWILEPLEMHRTTAETTHSMRSQMAEGYRHLYDDRPQHIDHPLVPADWVETNSADGCILSTAEDMAKFARMLLNEGIGPYGPLVSKASYNKIVSPMIEDEGEAYSYGLYLFEDEGYRHAGHGGDVPGYESYLWLDLDNGLGSVMLMTQPYTPRASFLALENFRAAYLGHRLPDKPPVPDFTFIGRPQEYAGEYNYSGDISSGQCRLRLAAEGHHLILICEDQRVVLEEREPDCFYADHPAWNLYLLRFGRSMEGKVTEVFYGPHWFTAQDYKGPVSFEIPTEWKSYIGHYRSHNPWSTNFRVFVRKGQLILSSPSGEEEILVPLGSDQFRIGEQAYIPERMHFDQFIEGQAQRAIRSGCPYYRFFTP